MSGVLKQEKDTARQTRSFPHPDIAPLTHISAGLSMIPGFLTEKLITFKSDMGNTTSCSHSFPNHHQVGDCPGSSSAHLCSYCCVCYSLFVWLRYFFKYERAYSCMGKERRGSKRSCSRGKNMIKM